MSRYAAARQAGGASETHPVRGGAGSIGTISASKQGATFMRKHVVAGALAAAVAGSGALALFTGVAQAAPVASHQAAATTYTFTTLNDQADPTFNQLLGINVHNVIAGYFGSGAAGHPNKGYLLKPPYGQGNYVNENFPG